MPSSNRRAVLAAIGSGVGLSLAGCIGQESTSDNSSPSTAGTAAGTDMIDTDAKLSLPSVVTHDGFPDGDVVLKPDGKIVLLNFFTTWCRPCQKEMPAFRKLRSEYDAETLHMVSITPEVDESLIRQFWSEYEGTWPVVNDPGLVATDQWNANSYPTNLVFDTDGTPATGEQPEVRARTFEEFNSIIAPLVET